MKRKKMKKKSLLQREGDAQSKDKHNLIKFDRIDKMKNNYLILKIEER